MSSLIVYLYLVLLDACVSGYSSKFHSSSTSNFDWAALNATSNVIWHDCYSTSPESAQHILKPSRKTSCARLSVPLSYQNISNPRTVSIAVLKISSPPSPSHQGIITLMVGGGGESRIKLVDTLFRSGTLDVIDPDMQHDFVTFDNRGTGFTSPKAECFDSIIGAEAWNDRANDLSGVISNADERSLETRLASAKAFGEVCAGRGVKDAELRRHISTPYVVRDMLEILTRIQAPDLEVGKIWEDLKVKYIGISYGTVVGQMLATVYPHHVSRMLLDGTADVNDWFGRWQLAHQQNADAIWATFSSDCFAAKVACPLWRATDPHAFMIYLRVEAWVESLKTAPAYIVRDGTAKLITHHEIRTIINWTTYSPSLMFPILADLINNLMRGVFDFTSPFDDAPPPCIEESAERWADMNLGVGATLNCGELEDISQASLSEFILYLAALEAISPQMAFFQGERRLRCLGWPSSLRTNWRFAGPFGSTNLSTPILFLSNTMDPMTPIANAHRMAKAFPGSVVLEQRARGHGSLINVALCPCGALAISTYLRDGTLPPIGTVCGEECNAFDGSCSAVLVLLV